MLDQGLFTLLAAGHPGSQWYDNAWLIGTVTGVASGALLAAFAAFVRRMRKAPSDSAGGPPAKTEPALRPIIMFGGPTHLGSGDVNQAAHDIRTSRDANPARRAGSSRTPPADRHRSGDGDVSL